jgi:hypothetical protein
MEPDMADQCPSCGAELPEPPPGSCPACLKTLAADTGITAAVEGSFTDNSPHAPPLPRLEEDTPSIVKTETTGPPCPALVLIGLSTFLCAAQGMAASLGKPGGVTFKSEETAIGAIVGLVIGVALAVDHWFFQMKLNRPAKIPGEDQSESSVPVPRPSEWIAIVMLMVPIVAGVVMWFAVPLRLTGAYDALIGSGAIVATAVLGYFSIRQMALRENRTASHYHGSLSSPAFMYLAILFFWIILYPVHFVIRWRMGGRNLIIPGIIATAVYFAQIVQPFLVEAELPPVDDAEALALVKQLIEADPALRPANVKNAVEVSFDAAQQRRVGRCTLAAKHGDEPIEYTINWKDRQSGLWQVELRPYLPAVDSKEVIDVLNGLVQAQQGFEARIRNPVQTSYDSAKQKRSGVANVNTRNGEARITYTVEWDNRAKGMFRVDIQP